MLMNFDKLIIPQGISPIVNGGKRKHKNRHKSRRHKKSNKSRTRRKYY